MTTTSDPPSATLPPGASPAGLLRPGRALGAGPVLLGAALVACSLAVAAVDRRPALYGLDHGAPARSLLLGLSFAVPAAVALLTGRRGLGAVLSVAAAGTCLYGLRPMLRAAAQDGGTHLPPVVTELLGGAGTFAMHGALVLLPLWVPRGRLEGGRRWRVAIAALVAVYALCLATVAAYGWSVTDVSWDGSVLRDRVGWYRVAAQVTVVLPRLLAVVVLVDLLRRRRTARGRARHRLTVTAVGYAVYWLLRIVDRVHLVVTSHQLAEWAVHLGNSFAVIALALVSVAAALPQGFTSFDRTLRRGFLAMSLPIALCTCCYGLYLVSCDLLGLSRPTAAALAAALGALALRPAAGLLWRVGDLLLYGRRAKPYEMLRALGEELRRRMPADEVPGVVCATVVERLGLPGAVLVAHTRVQGGGKVGACARVEGGSGSGVHARVEGGSAAGACARVEGRVLARAGEVDEAGGRFVELPLTERGERVGVLAVALRPGQRALDATDLAALKAVADRLGTVVAAIRLREELRGSRERVVTAREEERRRLRRDLHDGLGPTLAGLRLRLDAAAGLLPSSSPPRALVESASEEAVRGLEEVHRLVDDLRPAALDGGLAAALTALVARFDSGAPRVVADIAGTLPPLPAATETAAYRITSEALANAVRHAGAGVVRVVLRVAEGGVEGGGAVVLEVWDDGVGAGGGSRVGGGSQVEGGSQVGVEADAGVGGSQVGVGYGDGRSGDGRSGDGRSGDGRSGDGRSGDGDGVGVGFGGTTVARGLGDAPRASAAREGVGLASMVERAEEIGGHCTVSARDDGTRGTVVRAVLPVRA
ncbi:histidine kinase [Streptomyces sp. NPDC004539]|uniref:GAF domain-containing sensor histidine kinase n=1 Tax=Streptomyces sp. NPDC004539 TaxID=3154280 RepID=UPI0033A3B9E6